MKRVVRATAVAFSFAAPMSVFAQNSSELSELKAQLEALNARIVALEAREAQDAKDAAEAKAKAAKTSSWTDRVAVNGDFRYRVEGIDEDGRDTASLQRMRARLFVDATVNDTTTVRMQVGTGGANPRSQDATFTEDGSSKDVALRQAYVSWKPLKDLAIAGGKMPVPWTLNPVDFFHDSDYFPEGIAVRYGGGAGFFGSSYWLQVAERSSDDDTSLWGAQVGYASDGFFANVGYQDFQTIRGFNPCYSRNCNGNSVDGAGNLVNDYDILQVRGGVTLAGLTVFASWAQNVDADAEDTAYSYGFAYGKVKDPGSWSVAVLYQDVEKDALYGGMLDATFAGGRTAHDGYSLSGAYALSKNWVGSFIWYDNDIDKTGNERDYSRYQLDLLWKF